jgi:hypothetical protein
MNSRDPGNQDFSVHDFVVKYLEWDLCLKERVVGNGLLPLRLGRIGRRVFLFGAAHTSRANGMPQVMDVPF